MKGELTAQGVRWAFRVILDRDADRAAIARQLRANRTLADLRQRLLASQEFQQKSGRVLETGHSALAMVELEGHLRLWVDLADQDIGVPVVRGTFEPNELAFVRASVSPGSSVVDLGANIGFFTVVMAAAAGPQGRVHSFEPRPELADLLARSVHENDFTDRVVVERAAAGAEPGSLPLAHSRDRANLGSGFLVREGTNAPGWMALETVPVTTLDASALRRPVSFIKMDIEGAEPLAMAGAQKLLREDRPLILSELHQRQLEIVSGRSAAGFIQEMKEIGYRCRRLTDGKLGAEVHRSDPEDVFSVVFVPE
jgi:FkbM family methyltransferase